MDDAGWTYGLDGKLKKALRLKGIKDFSASEYGLRPIAVDTASHWIFMQLGRKIGGREFVRV